MNRSVRSLAAFAVLFTPLLTLVFAIKAPSVAFAAERTPGIALEELHGRIHLDSRLRFELADIDGADFSTAFTLRTRLGFGTDAWNGLSAYIEMENVATPDDDTYFDGASTPNGESLIADPRDTELNRAFIKYDGGEELPLEFIGYRQRITFDDHRFIGNVGWRANEQTYDAALLRSSVGVEDLMLTYAYVWEVHRIFGDQGGAATRDFEDAKTHLINMAFNRFAAAKISAFIYLMDFEDSPGNSSNTFGFRVSGQPQVSDDVSVEYQASYARQTDAGDNPVGYDANYYFVDAAVGAKGLGKFGVGYEVLGSDDGLARFVTPLATGHKFNGFADVFLNNGDVDGLRDLYAYYAPPLPCGLNGKLIYHSFENDDGGNYLGNELDAVVAKQVNDHVKVIGKVAWFDGTGSNDPADRVRASLEANLLY